MCIIKHQECNRNTLQFRKEKLFGVQNTVILRKLWVKVVFELNLKFKLAEKKKKDLIGSGSNLGKEKGCVGDPNLVVGVKGFLLRNTKKVG